MRKGPMGTIDLVTARTGMEEDPFVLRTQYEVNNIMRDLLAGRVMEQFLTKLKG